ncbi:peptidase family M49 domain-containing protein [Hirsutella rhossiliensis]|uniref:Peptidase family m49 domain-containing protein n=1 Tax=Hirsutella rhossiliensis TaxID=111463 RepID=A0A9P8N2J4_9HYPO|nr:peptidase family m49 domain-containing protein [Hirsutella rhossiliensis]KAH0965747.1 peptidase family m49 domain-containing protein [Hirsutella rhossiliensis]
MSRTESSHAPPTGAVVHQLVVKPVFDALEPREKRYAHHMARAAWHGSRIIMSGDWDSLVTQCGILPEELEAFLEYAGTFLCNLGNFYGEGDQKFVPDLSIEALRKISSISPKAKDGLDKIVGPLFAVPPFSLGYPSKNAQSAYYPGTEPISQLEVAKVSEAMGRHSIGPENTRIRKLVEDGKPVYQLLQASAETAASNDTPQELADGISLIKGDHTEELSKVCLALEKAKEYASNRRQVQFLTKYVECFRTGSLETFQESQKVWVSDVSARVEHLIGFIEPYRDPAGIRSEWEAMIGIADSDEVSRLKRLVESSTAFIRHLPWAVEGVNDGKGPFEKSLFEAPDFTSVHALAVCGSIVFEAANLPNYEYIRETCGFKNIVLANRLSANNNPKLPCYWVLPSELKRFKSSTHIVRYITTAIHELLGHGTSKLLGEIAPGVYNFDKQNPPISPITGEPVTSHYRLGQTWGSVFGKLAGTVEECRAILVSEYLMDDKKLLEIFGYTDDSEITADDLLYTTYLNIGVDGLQALEHYNFQSQAWGQVHHQAHFSILKHLLQDGGGVIRIAHDPAESSLTVHIDRSKFISHGKPALGHYLCRLHIWRCTADAASCKAFYEPLCAVEGEYEQWRQIVCSKPKPRWKFVQPNTSITGDEVEMKVYEESNRGIIQSWVERGI